MRRQQYNGQLTIDNGQLYRKKYLWNYENQLMKVEINKKSSNDTYVVSFAYNGDGQRIYKETSIEDESGNETKLSAILYVRNSFGEVIEEHSLDLSSLPSIIYHLTSTYIFGNGKRIMSINSSDSMTYYLSDILGSNSLLTDDEGNPLQLTKYDEFGNTYYEFTQHNEVGAVVDNNYKYTGKPLDKETGLYYYGARYYNSRWGRFTSKDPGQKIRINKSITMNEYIYCLNNPLILVDLDGKDAYLIVWKPTLFDLAGHTALGVDEVIKGKLTGRIIIYELYPDEISQRELLEGKRGKADYSTDDKISTAVSSLEKLETYTLEFGGKKIKSDLIFKIKLTINENLKLMNGMIDIAKNHDYYDLVAWNCTDYVLAGLKEIGKLRFDFTARKKRKFLFLQDINSPWGIEKIKKEKGFKLIFDRDKKIEKSINKKK